MTLANRIRKLEMIAPPALPAVTIFASDVADMDAKVEDAIIEHRGAGPLRIVGAIDGQPFSETIRLLAHEDALSQLDI